MTTLLALNEFLAAVNRLPREARLGIIFAARNHATTLQRVVLHSQQEPEAAFWLALARLLETCGGAHERTG